MCGYCGCGSISVIARFSAEHETIGNVAGELRRAAEANDAGRARRLVYELAELLHAHTSAEERGLFAALRSRPEFADHIASLCAEHAVLDDGLDAVRTDLDASDGDTSHTDLDTGPIGTANSTDTGHRDTSHTDPDTGHRDTSHTDPDAGRAGQGDALADFLRLLYRHIDKEENGVFPATITALSGDEWDRVDAATSAPASFVAGRPPR